MAMTAKDLLAMKTDLIKKKNQTIDIDIKDMGTWTFYVPTFADISDATVYRDEHYGESNSPKLDSILVFRQTKEPNLYEQDVVEMLAEVSGNGEKTAGEWEVETLLKAGQITRISRLLMKQAGFSEDSAVAVIENEIKGAEEVKK